MSERILVTGGAGFIGSHVVPRLLRRGARVTVFDNLSTGRRGAVPADAAFIQGDVCEAPAIAQAMQGHTAVLHLAARVAIRSSFEFAVQDTQVNVVGTAAVMRAVAQAGSVRRVVAASSMAVYADSAAATPIAEEHPARPQSPYGISKLALEQLVHAMARAAGVTSTVLRFFNTYGPGQALSPYVGVVTIFTHALMRGQSPTVFGDGGQCRDFVHVDDIADGCVRALFATDLDAVTMNLGTGLPTSVNELLRQTQAALGTALPVHHAPAVPGELRNSIADIGLARRLLGYAPGRTLAQSLPEVVHEIAQSARAPGPG